MALLTLDPENAAPSIALRIRQIEQAKAYIREVVARYDGLNSFEAKLTELGIAAEVHAIVAEGEPS